MDACTPRHSSAAALFLLGVLLHDAAVGLRKLGRRLDARISARKEAANDRRPLDQMTDHDLRDIGVSRAELRAVGIGWFSRDHDNGSIRGAWARMNGVDAWPLV